MLDTIGLDLGEQQSNEDIFKFSYVFTTFLHDFMVKSRLPFPDFYWLKDLGTDFFTRV
jgi:hypothetical protein